MLFGDIAAVFAACLQWPATTVFEMDEPDECAVVYGECDEPERERVGE